MVKALRHKKTVNSDECEVWMTFEFFLMAISSDFIETRCEIFA